MKAFSLLFLLFIILQAGPPRPREIGVITGVIRSSDGAPAAKVRVFARPTATIADETVLEAQAETDASGRYRLEVAPGQYYIATGFIDSPTWYPGTSDVAAARPIMVSSNQTMAALDITALATSVLAGNIQVQVVSISSGSPLQNVTVELTGTLAPAPTRGTQRQVSRPAPRATALTDASGNVVFLSLAPGRYVAQARFSGYLVPETLSAVVNQTQPSHWLQVRMTPSATISGRLRGANGRPLASVPVWAGVLEYIDGRRKLVSRAMTQTDAQGRYRLAPLEPGAYYVVGERDKADLLGLTSTFYPGTANFDDAKPVAVRHAQDLSGIEFDVLAPRTFSISGRVQNSPGRITTFQVVRHDRGAESPYPIELTNASPSPAGDFVLRGVPAGSWDVFPLIPRSRPAPSQPAFAVAAGQVDVVDRDVSGVAITLSPTPEVRGRVVMPNGTAMPPEISVALVPRDSKPPTLVSHLTNIQHVTATNGTFVFPGVPSGKYSIRLSYVPEGYHLEGLRAGSRDLFETGLIEVGSTPVEPVEVILGNGGSTFRGFFHITLAYMNADQLRDVRVTLVPSGARRSNFDLYRTLTIPRAGEPFVFSGVVPGDYKVFAWSKLPPDAEKSPEFIQQYEQLGVEVRVTEGRVDDVQVALIAAP